VVTNPCRRSHVLAVHAGLTPAEAHELAHVYQLLGYPDGTITVTEQGQAAA